ncbi:hypothetical protein EDD11_003035 [Mortierella claussenii]|nr:hypothetical protein EDD11_003035 [Mortierella claussenii]
MLSIASSTASLRRWAGLTVPTVSAHTCANRIAITAKARSPLVQCRFRHNPQPSRKSGGGGYTAKRSDRESGFISYDRPSTGPGLTSYNRPPRGPGSSYGRPQQTGRAFGGQEYNPHWEAAALKNALHRFRDPSKIQSHLESLGTPQYDAVELIKHFSEKALRGEVPEVSKKVLGALANQALEVGMTFKSMGVTREEAIAAQLDRTLWDAFFIHCESMFPPDTLFRLSRMRNIADLRFPSEWTPGARLLKRKIIMHVGPTNSGKTYNALLRLQEAESGSYLSPLRLLAHEVFERMNSAGTPCNLVTGEERRYGVIDENGKPVPGGAKVLSCTVEMASFDRKIEVAVIDEIQMLADPDRGWAWTAALLGLPAQEIHLCGEPTVVDLVKKICAMTNEEVTVHRYDRLSKMEVQDESLRGDLKNIQKGDCVVTFSRNNIFMLKKAIEAETGLRCAVAYGSLPPESRSQQAKLFNDPKSGYDVLVASDAIGMGLNLNIRRIIFEALEKFDGVNVRQLSLTQIKQIAGRAGRFGTEYAVGQATTLVQSDIPILKKALATPMIEIGRAGIQPFPEMIEEFSLQMPGAPFSHVLKMFEMMCRNSNLFFLALFRNMVGVAKILDHIELPVRERLPFISAPIQVRDSMVVDAALKMARGVSIGKRVGIDEVVSLPSESSKMDKLDLKTLESSHRIVMLYLWLSQRYPSAMTGGAESDAYKRKLQCETLIELALAQNESKRLKRVREQYARQEAERGEKRALAAGAASEVSSPNLVAEAVAAAREKDQEGSARSV